MNTDYQMDGPDWARPIPVLACSWDERPREDTKEVDSIELANRLLAELRNLPVATLRQEVSELRAAVSSQERTIKAHGEILARLQGMLEAPDISRDEYSIWVESTEADAFAGKYVAFVPGLGAVESAGTIKELRLKIKDNARAKNAAIVSVPHASY